MTWVEDVSDNAGSSPVGPVVQGNVQALVHGLPATVPISTNALSNVFSANGFKLCTAVVQSTQAGSLTIKAFVDAAGTIQRGSTVTVAIVANTPTIADLSGYAPFQSLQVGVSNSSGTTVATLSNLQILLQAA